MRRLDVALAPLAVFAILVTTAVPAEIRGDVGWSLRLSGLDLLQNVLLYAPLGVALASRRLSIVGAIAFVFSFAIEITQMWGIGRFASPWDLLTNTGGALLGAWWASRQGAAADLGVVCLRATPARLVTLAGSGVVVLALWWRPALDPGLDLWDASYPGWLGNERTGDRPWSGRYDALELVGRALSPADVAALHASPSTWSDSAVRYTLAAPFELRRAPAVRLPDDAVRAFVRSAMLGDAFSIVARITPHDLSLFGPARIVSISTDTLYRNVDLGQDGSLLVLRVRTRVSGTNAQDLRVNTRAVLRERRSVDVVATYDGRIGRIFVDGRLAARTDFEAAGCASRALCDWAAPAAWGLLGVVGALLALAVGLAIWPATVLPWRLPLALSGAGISVAAVLGSPVRHIVVGTHGWLPVIAFIAAGVVWFAHARAVRVQLLGRAISRW
ncbi:MAG: VanZ family protein [Gemmatimonadaceae bacterium]|nr:VanZ family protein [Gemmatimonadaceae bacterium]